MCSKDCKQFNFAALAAVLLSMGFEILNHEVLLKPIYDHPWYQTLRNTAAEMKGRRWSILLAHVVFGLAFAKIYTAGYEEEKPALGQGLRFGFYAGWLVSVHIALVQYYVYPVSWRLAAEWAGSGMIECMLIGAAVASIYHPHKEAI